jgi:hypothetical protein
MNNEEEAESFEWSFSRLTGRVLPLDIAILSSRVSTDSELFWLIPGAVAQLRCFIEVSARSSMLFVAMS